MGAGGSRVLYFVPERPALADGVLHAQVLTPARYLMERDFQCLFLGTEVSDEKAIEAQEMIERKYGVPAHVYGLYSMRVPYFSSVWTALRVRRRAKDLIRAFGPTHVYTRGYNAAVGARRVAHENDATLVFDVRGVASAETAMKRGEGPVYRFQLNRELSEIRRADRLTCVSHHLKDWIGRHTGRRDVSVIPCCVDLDKFTFREEARRDIRERHGVPASSRLLCYCGDIARWQRIEDIVRLCSRVAAIRPAYRFLFLCRQRDAVKRMVHDAGLSLDRCIITGCAHDEVPSYLSAADAGIIMRADTTVNNVASPVKVAEYLGCGLPVILTRGIGDYSDAVERDGLGLLLDESGDTAGQVAAFMDHADGAALRAKAVAFARTNVTWEAHLGSLMRLFDGRPDGSR